MARLIDPTVKLSDEDRTWLISRNNHALIRQIDENTGVEQTSPIAYEPHENASNPDAVAGLERRADVAEAALNSVISWLDAHVGLETDQTSADPAKRIIEALTGILGETTEPGPDAAEAEDFPDNDDESIDQYSGWNNDDLRAELEKRELSRSGSKADLIARLTEDDAQA
jgi:hypothetical protein